MTIIWKYISNQMDLETEHNLTLALTLSYFHDSALFALSTLYPAMLFCYLRYHPLHLALVAGASTLDSSGGTKQGDRVSLAEVLVSAHADLVELWLPTILLLHNKASARYKAILPKGLKPFNSNKIDTRIAAYNTLALNIGADVALAATKALVVTAHADLLAARGTQKVAKTTTGSLSDTLETLRLAAMDMQYRNLGYIMDNLFNIRETVCSLVFDLTSMRSSPQTLFTGKLIASQIKDVLAKTFLPVATLSIKTNVAIKLYLSNTIGGITGTAIDVPANIKTTINVADFGVTDYSVHRFLTIVNQGTLPGKYAVTIL